MGILTSLNDATLRLYFATISWDNIAVPKISAIDGYFNKGLQLLAYFKHWILIIIVLFGTVMILKDIGQLQAVGKESPEGQQITKNIMWKVVYMVIAGAIPYIILAIYNFFIL